jgi:glutamate dehydrogenase/leucine dehydrogenase
MRRMLIENGGKVVDKSDNARYIICEDGFNKKLWVNDNEKVDEKNRIIIHFRWVEECIKENKMLGYTEAYHLMPMPMAEF